jgi:hypothetical protein
LDVTYWLLKNLRPGHHLASAEYLQAWHICTWHKEYSEFHDCHLSQTGYIITYWGCPIHWASILQTEIVLSTTKSEYITTSMPSHELIHLWQIITKLHILSLVYMRLVHTTTWAHLFETSKIFQENASCIVACSDSTKTWTKQPSIKWHHFQNQLKAGQLKISPMLILNLNWADNLTKPSSAKLNALA